MSYRSPSETRVLAIDPTYRGLAYAVLERGPRVVDWGARDARHGEKNRRALKRFEELVAHYEPHVLVIEDCAAKGSRRRPRIERLVKAIERIAATKDIEVHKISRAVVDEAFFHADASNKQEIATVITKRFPQLAVWLPLARTRWTTEDYRMHIFDAVAFGLTFFYLEDEETRAA